MNAKTVQQKSMPVKCVREKITRHDEERKKKLYTICCACV